MNKTKAKISNKPSIPPNTVTPSASERNSGPIQNTTPTSMMGSRSTPPSRNKSEKDIPYEGIYQNLRFCETITSLMGNTVQIQLSNGKIFEGIFSTFSPQLEVVLELVHTVDPNQPEKIDVSSVAREVVFGSQLIVTMSSKDVELDYARKDSFATDTSISRFNGLMGEKELEPWEGDDEGCHISLDDANGWDPNDMFARNEKVYGIQSDFEQDLSQYTYKLEKKDSKEYKEMEARASKLANIIESSTSSKAQTELENVSDEEEKFSAVVRPSHDSSRDRHDSRDFRDFTRSDRGSASTGPGAGGAASVNSAGGKYVHPNKRPTKGIQNMSKMMRSTPPPHSHGGHTHSNLPPRHQSSGGGGGGGGGGSSNSGSYHGTNYDGDGRGSHSSHGSPGPAHHGSYHQQGGSQHQAFQPSQGRGSSGPYGGYGHGPNRSQGQGSSSYNNKLSAQQSEPRMNGEERKVSRESPYESKGNHAPPHQQAQSAQRDHAPKEQRKSYPGKNREDHSSELKKFSQDFRLSNDVPTPTTASAPTQAPASATAPASAPAPASTPVSASVTVSTPAPADDKKTAPAIPVAIGVGSVPLATTSSVTTASNTSAGVVSSPAAATAPAVALAAIASVSAPALVSTTSPPPTPAVPQPVTNVPAQPVTQTQIVVSSVTGTPVASSPPVTAQSEVAPPSSASSAEDKSSAESVDKVSETLKKSNLNPNAKEFVLNPNARVFVPTPPRSHTPQTPQGGGGSGGGQIMVTGPMGTLAPVGPGLAGSGASPGQGIMMPVVHYVPANATHGGAVQNQGPGGAANQPHFPGHNAGGARYRKPPMPVAHRPDLASSMHVAAATGQPLMAPAPMGGPQLFYPSQGGIIPGTPHQPYPQLYTMRVVPGTMTGMVPTSVYGDSQSAGQAPIYMSPGHAQGGNQGPMAPPQQQQQQHHHPNSTPSPAQQHSMAQTPTGNPPQQLIYQTAGGHHHGHNPGPPHSHPHTSFPMVFLPPGHSTLPPGVTGPNVGSQGMQIVPIGSSSAAGMAAMGMMPQIHYIQQAPGTGGQPSHMQPTLVPHNQ